MCGLAGFLGYSINTPNNKIISDCKNSLKRRGPDASGVFNKIKNKKSILLIHTRLSIVDLSKNSSQPFSDEKGSLIFNGMIYNYLELKKHLKEQGEKFKTTSDTEVLLKMLNRYKEKAFKMLDGMWVIAYFSKLNGDLIISRDRFGEKPLYYSIEKSGFYFSNSIKALHILSGKKLVFNNSKIKKYLSYPDKVYGLDNETFFKNIKQFPTATYLKLNIEKNKKKKFYKFWKLSIKNNNESFSRFCNHIKKITKKTIETRIRSNVSNSVLVSGGLDSNTVTAHANKISKVKGYSLLSSNPYYDERKQIFSSQKLNRFKTIFIPSKNNSSLKLLKDMIEYGFNPLLTTTALALGLVCQKIKKDKNKVLLTGIGGDELFCGYYINILAHILSFRKHKKFKEKYLFWEKNVKNYIRNPNLKNFENSLNQRNKYRLNFFIEQEENLKNFFKKFKKIRIKKVHKDIFYNNMLQNIYFQSIPSQVYQSDYVCMFFSIENRSPFLAKNLFEKIYQSKKDYFMYKGVPKSVLRTAMSNYFPKEIFNNYEKIGFYSPLKSFFSKKDLGKIKKLIMNSKILKKNLKIKYLKKLISKTDLKYNTSDKFIFACLNIAILENSINK